MIRVHNLWKRYGRLEVLKGVNLTIEQGKTLVILGRSGIGKSVLLKQIIGLEPPDRGYIEIDGQRVNAVSEREGSAPLKRIGFLFQGAALFDSMTIEENIKFYPTEHQPDLSKSELNDRVADALKMVGLSDIQKKFPSELSGGMRKRAGLARVIVYNPDIILYDEPTTGLDPITCNQINDLINMIKQEFNTTSVVVTHDMRSALEVADLLTRLENGHIDQPMSKKTFLESTDPFIQDFLKYALITQSEMEKYSQ